MGRPYPLTTAQGGMNLLRTKGGARADTLLLLKNAWVTQTGSIMPRNGVIRDQVLPAGTNGLMPFTDKLYVFASTVVASPNPKYIIEVLRHPTNAAATIVEIHFSAPFMGAPYVVAEWSDGAIYHYWLQSLGAWKANSIYLIGDVVLPTVTNGFAYKAARLTDPNPVWAPNAARAIGNKVEPTTYNGYYFEVIATIGASPRSGATEPAWNAENGALTYEDVDLTTAPPAGSGQDSGSATVPPSVQDRYQNQGGIARGDLTNQQER